MAGLSALIVLTVMFFAVSFSNGASEIRSYRDRLDHVSGVDGSADVQTLQASIDSMQAVNERYVRALQVLDTLLIGSDRWSRVLEETAREAAAVKDIWVEGLTPTGNVLAFTGTATSRESIVAFAERVGGTISMLTFSEIREWPVYTFKIEVTVQDELPAAARYLREHVAVPDAGEAVDGESVDL